uniref:Uncharacterized protein n=1 Tax=Glaesserella parasuis TaxID=738 RepID=A0A3S5XHJ0_GLAPU|nr:hypothetical protein [Glaesserella parasuis]QBB00146.1 hypothetical protein [Glaesserella parasuis]
MVRTRKPNTATTTVSSSIITKYCNAFT